jgi:GNAT superfamily N-acetyltransferase
MLTIRSVQWPDDAAVLAALDTAFITDCIYRPVREALSFRLVEETVTPPLRKDYAFDASDPAERENWEFTALAEEEGQLAGFAAAHYVAWNRRVVVWALYIMPSYRRRGVGTRLLEALDTYARSVQARCLWLETQNVNYPAIQFYQHSGFTLCGFDEALYDPETLNSEEVALFFARPVL